MGFIFFIILLSILIGCTGFILKVAAIVDIVRSRFPNNDAIGMILLVVLVPFGSIIYFLIAPSRKLIQ